MEIWIAVRIAAMHCPKGDLHVLRVKNGYWLLLDSGEKLLKVDDLKVLGRSYD